MSDKDIPVPAIIKDLEWDEDIEWTDEELEAPTCNLENPDICESCT